MDQASPLLPDMRTPCSFPVFQVVGNRIRVQGSPKETRSYGVEGAEGRDGKRATIAETRANGRFPLPVAYRREFVGRAWMSIEMIDETEKSDRAGRPLREWVMAPWELPKNYPT